MLRSNRQIAKGAAVHLPLDERIAIEQVITDGDVARANIDALIHRPNTFESMRRSWLNPGVFDWLGSVEGKTVLDLGCGYSMTPISLAKGGATVIAIDVSQASIDAVRRAATVHGLTDRVRAEVCPAEMMPFDDHSVDLVYGASMLHHVDIGQTARELLRVMKPGARGGFLDPLGHNPVLEFARDRVPYRGKPPHKGTDRPLKVQDIDRFGRHFAAYSWRGHQLLTMIDRVLSLKRRRYGKQMLAALNHADRVLFRRIPRIERYARYAEIRVLAP